MWSSSDLQTRQLPHIGEVMSRALAAGEKKLIKNYCLFNELFFFCQLELKQLNNWQVKMLVVLN